MKACASLLVLILLGVSGLAGFGMSQQMEGESGGDTEGGAVGNGVVGSDAGYFTADTTGIPAGGCVNLAWSRPGASTVVMQGSNWPEGQQEALDLAGSTLVCPSAALNYVPNVPVNYTLITTYPDGTTWTEVITITYSNIVPDNGVSPTPTPVPFVPPPATWTPFPTDTPSAPPVPTDAPPSAVVTTHYQEFEHGFMVELVNGQSMFETTRPCVYIYSDMGIVMPDPGVGYSYCTPAIGPDNTQLDAPEGLIAPTGVFGQVWANYAGVKDALGYATAADFYYDGVVPPSESVVLDGVFYAPIVTLPNGQQFYCGSRGATASSCQLR